jgi:ketosteroid isomerase-like protein
MSAAENLATIERLYAALNSHDGEAMAACYTPDATFRDPAFGKLGDGGGQDMWRMLTANPDSDLAVTLADKSADDHTGTAHWLADYTFPDTGKKVHNDVRAAFVFRDGLIAEHVDSFDLRAWAGQALGTTGKVLGLTPFLSKIIQGKTSGKLTEYRAAKT